MGIAPIQPSIKKLFTKAYSLPLYLNVLWPKNCLQSLPPSLFTHQHEVFRSIFDKKKKTNKFKSKLKYKVKSQSVNMQIQIQIQIQNQITLILTLIAIKDIERILINVLNLILKRKRT